MSKIVVKTYDYSNHQEVVECETSTRDIAKSITPAQLGEIIAEFGNSLGNAYKNGGEVGKAISQQHRTLQGCAVNMLVSALVAMADTGTDARNETAIETCRRIRMLVSTDQIHYQPFI